MPMMLFFLSATETSMQRCISKLEKYCDNWYIEVYLVTPKIIVFNKAGKLYDLKLTYEGRMLGCVRD